VQRNNDAGAVSDRKHRETSDQKRDDADDHRRYPIVPMHPHQFRITGEVGGMLENFLLRVAFVGHAAKPAKPKTLVRAVHVPLGVRILMMNAMLAGKPDRIAESHARQHAHEELKCAAGLESSMRKIAMQTAAEPEGIKQGEADADEPIDRARSRENRDDRQSVQANDKD